MGVYEETNSLSGMKYKIIGEVKLFIIENSNSWIFAPRAFIKLIDDQIKKKISECKIGTDFYAETISYNEFQVDIYEICFTFFKKIQECLSF